jgi:hypothetical protein
VTLDRPLLPLQVRIAAQETVLEGTIALIEVEITPVR